MRRIHWMVVFVVAICARAAEPPKSKIVSFDTTGMSKSEIPALKAGEWVYFDVPKTAGKPDLSIVYQFSAEIGDGKVLELDCVGDSLPGAQSFDDKPFKIPASVTVHRTGAKGDVVEEKPVRALYFNVTGRAPLSPKERAQLADLESQSDYLSSKQKPLTWRQTQEKKDQISDLNDRIAQNLEDIKAFTGTSLNSAVAEINDRQQRIHDLRDKIKEIQREIDGADPALQTKIDVVNAQIRELKERAGEVLFRAGVLAIGEDRKPLYYALKGSGDPSAPWLLTHFQKFPVLTTNDVPYVVVLGQRSNQEPLGLKVSFTSKAGSYINEDPVRPMVAQDTAKGLAFADRFRAPRCESVPPPNYAYVDLVRPFTGRLTGETIYSITVSGYGTIAQTDTISVNTGNTPANQHQTVMAKVAVKALDGEALPQVHSLYRYNLSTGVVWSTIRTPTFSRVATGGYLPAGCAPSTTVTNTGAMSSATTSSTTTTSGTTSTTSGTTTAGAPSSSTTATCLPTYQTQEVSGGPRILPVMMFTFYPKKRDTQIKTVQWSEVIPAPSVGLSLTSPTNDFFVGASSELKPFRNLQLVYGLHLGRVSKFGSNGFQNPLDSTAPQTTTSLHTGAFVGLTFNIDFIKALFKP